METPPESTSTLLAALGQALHKRRKQVRLTQQIVAERSGISVRFLSQMEAGCNFSLANLFQVAGVLGINPSSLLQEAEEKHPPKDGVPRTVALIGLRGAGKSTIGKRLAEALRRPFVELDERIEEDAGLSLGEIFALHGEAYYRSLERKAVERLFGSPLDPPPILATGGGLVTEPATYDHLRRQAITVWLRATPDEHWQRVVQQGDERPMAGTSDMDARAQLSQLLREREALYAQASLTVDTSVLGVEGAVSALLAQLK